MPRHLWRTHTPTVAPSPVGEPQHGQNRRSLPGVLYILPNDLPKASRLDVQHALLQSVIGSKYIAPIEKQVSRIKDTATGTGRWAHARARACPGAEVIGLDREAPPEIAESPNSRVVQDNLFAGLPFADRSFAYVHQRFLVLPTKQWPFLLSELLRATQPGGSVERVEGRGTVLRTGPATTQLKQWWDLARQTRGMDVSLMEHVPDLVQGACVPHGASQTFPVGQAGGQIGRMLQHALLASLAGIKSFICKNASISRDLFGRTIAALAHAWKAYTTCDDYSLAYGQRRRG